MSEFSEIDIMLKGFVDIFMENTTNFKTTNYYHY